ncbi:3-hydroxyacyl-CoA dehydrogenase family protein [Hymenobacter radiodurans]|uniref:3-hydroxyacyl-CoA dehydrogenase family protein n=1 Tax=Hymenobacter radiodurans TaxID=2496028 RepID=UPI001058FA22|nr:3-hydroxyacyl-CoA dehydrogenase family protein [Hymenobacter radiodurans]
MHLLIIDGDHMKAEVESKFGAEHEYSFFQFSAENGRQWQTLKKQLKIAVSDADIIMHFGLNENLSVFNEPGKVIFVECSTTSLSEAFWHHDSEGLEATLFGFCGLPTLLNRPLLEVSLYNSENAPQLAEICAALGTDYRVVQDRVGMVTPRVVCMIINEACYTLQEGTANIKDIDKSMKLGTNYPRGPFEWANLIGVSRVYDVLESLWQDTHDERYKVCPLLKTMYLRGDSFAL